MKTQNKKTLLEVLSLNNVTLNKLILLVNKWHDKSYDLTDIEWQTIKDYKTLLDLYFNDTELMQITINSNKKAILELQK